MYKAFEGPRTLNTVNENKKSILNQWFPKLSGLQPI